MNQRDFISLIKEPANNRAEDLDQLEKVADTFPYCQVAHILIAKISNDHSMMLADQKLKKASAYIANRPKLRRLINGQTNEITVEQLIQKFPKAVEETPKTKKTTTTEKPETPKAPITTKSKTETKQPVNNEDKENPYVNNDLISEVQATLAALKEETAKPTPKAKVKKAPVKTTKKKTTAAKKKTTTKKTAATTKAKRSVTTSKKTTPTKKVTAATKKKATTKTAPAKKTISKKAAGKKNATTKSSSTTTKKTAPKKKPVATKKASPKAKTAKSTDSKKKATPPKKTVKKTTAAKKTTTAKKVASSTPKKKTVTKKKAASTSKKTGSTTKTRKKSTASSAKTKKPTRKSTTRKSTSPSKKKPVSNRSTSTTKSYFEKEGVYNETDLLLDYLNSITSTSGADQKQLQEEILEKFIKENPSISPLKGAKKSKKKGDLSKKSVKADNELVSENLAKIFIKQNKLSKAVDIYKKLILKYPKKKAYFTSQIQKLRDK